MLFCKKVEESFTTGSYIVMPCHTNESGRLFGGILLEWLDLSAGITARRHSGRIVTTAAIDSISFKAPAYVNDTVYITSKITYTGRTSMEVRTDAYTEELSGERSLINTAYFVLIALDDNDKPCAVPKIIPETAEELAEYEAGKNRRKSRNS